MALTAALLSEQNAATSKAIIGLLDGDAGFQRLSRMTGEDIVARDRQDDEKLAKGIELSISRGVLQRIPPPTVTNIDVLGKSPQDIVGVIRGTGAGASGGCVIVLQGMAGTGKGTTADELKAALPRTATWSNGNVFRCLTLFAVTEFGDKVTADSASVVTPENVARWMAMLGFHQREKGKFDISIKGCGFDTWVSEVANTTLKERKVGAAIPSVAQYTQGDVVKFAAAALQQMAAAGMNVILEGRGPTVQYVPTPYRFELVLPDVALLGQRRAAQRIGAAAAQATAADAVPGAVADAVRAACARIVAEDDAAAAAGPTGRGGVCAKMATCALM